MAAGRTGAKVAKRVKLRSTRKATAKRLAFSGHADVSATITMQASMEEVMHRRQSLFVLTGEETLVSAYIVKAAAKALEDHRILDPYLNADAHPVHGGNNVAVTINAPDGLVAPVVTETKSKSVLELSREIKDLTDRAMKGSLTVSQSAVGTFVVTSLGAYDIELFSPAIRSPQRAILGFGRPLDRPIVIRKELRIAPTTILSLVFDDRIVDRLQAARFLQRVKDLLEDPSKLD
jgi:pyruvate dehydrogenase E2 component (dihydrolipoamide acetyltransferase)